MSKPEINVGELSPEDRLQLLDELWKSLSESPANIPFTNAQREELDRRIDDLTEDQTKGIPWEEVLDQIRRRHQ